jgi:DNA-binding NtrC family response regulator
MPDMNGVTLFLTLKDRQPALSAILMTAYSSDSLVNLALQEGAAAVFEKPLEIARLLQTLSWQASGA